MKTEIKKTDVNFREHYWLAKQKKDKSEVRDYIRYVMVKDGKLVSTNGAWLCEIETGLENGFYEIMKKTKTLIVFIKVADIDDITFPDYSDYIKPAENAVILDLKPSEDALDGNLTRVMGLSKDGFSVAAKTFMELTSEIAFTCYVDPKWERPLYFEGDNSKAALMKIRL